MSSSSSLVLTRPTADARRVVAGLPLALRLVLDAQQAGVNRIVLGAGNEELRPLLADARVRTAIDSEPLANGVVFSVPANFVLPRGLFKALLERGSSCDLASERVVYEAPFSFQPIEVSDGPSAGLAERRLFRALRKPQDGWTSRYLNRYISLALSRWLVKTPLTPNQVSVGILGVGLCGAYEASVGGYWPTLLGAFLFQAQSVLDGCDGEMSRVSYRGSHAGEWLDTVGDDLTNYGFFCGAALGLYKTSHNPLYLAAGAVTVLSGLIGSGLEYRYLIRIGSGDLLKYPLSQGQGTGRFAFIQPLFKRDTFVFMTLCAAALSLLGPMLCVFAAGALGVLIGVLKTELRLAREGRRSNEVER
ncbi:MAG TPA: hypothetical protein VGM29_08270 [Polyangiaceae bacterium]|jgi:CDP-L-myo-inositol myo-inositolphosphotransferase